MNLGRLLNPRTIALVGGRQAELAIEQCEILGFEGEIWPVHPSRDEVAGHRTFRSIDELPSAPDAAFVAVNRKQTVEVVRQLAKIGAGGAVCYAAGFAEAGDEGAELQRQLVDHNMPIIGPNCYGVINGKLGAALWPDVQGCERLHGERGAAIVTQSGNIALNLTMNTRGLKFTHVISIGNQASVRIEDCIAELAMDPDVAVIGVHAESIIDPIAFGQAAITAHSTGTPIVMLKTGVSEAAAHIAASHTAAIAKPADVYDALFERYGVVAVDSVNQLAATLGFLVDIGPLPGASLVSLSCSGGEASLVADRADTHGVTFASFDEAQEAAIRTTLGDLVAITNPLDYHTFIWNDETALTACFTAALDGSAEVAMLVLDWPTSGDPHTWFPTLKAIEAATQSTNTPTIVASTLPENMPRHVRQRLQQSGIAVAYSLDEALTAISIAAQVGQVLVGAPPGKHSSTPHRQHASQTITETAAKEILAANGIDVPRGLHGPPAEMDSATLRFPVVAKASGLTHKTDAGGVIVGIADEVALATAVADLGPLSDEILVEEQVTDGVAELVVTIRRDWPIGVSVILGSGGTLVELIGDTQTALAPVAEEKLLDMLRCLKVGKLLDGHRGGASAEHGAIAHVVRNLEALIATRPDIVEIEINPLIATPTRAVAVDALITLAETNKAEEIK
ncbi:MAG: acetate--CoA ligase family protein [Acidimicrobiia bacterium]|nr:acetate--CoA ligase family protein [Acidimicrobiia bacterium]